MLRQVLDSSSLRSAGYDAKLQILEIEFAHGAVYRYLEVPREVWLALLQAPSKGRHFHRHVRDVYPAERIS